ncbi:alpha/beta fold hydrolase [Nocardioides sp. B-3]|uniref:alpha/beta fold hydrolase n=1 Tax=Nocardioides sp. B-3 TaxID=2895565 RepID=UPI002152C49C|nr:alpha/beta hydrolase [Nocardioides sp. B-3]UUZ60248.1 alpha/beta fold hydrolase [Nocardioides sp. B-3]
MTSFSASAAQNPPAVAVSEEMFAPVSPDVEICYQTFGSVDDDPLLLVMGPGGPMIWWDDDFCTRLAGAGFHVIRYDNRDTGRSSRIAARVGRAQLVRAFSTGRGSAPYSISDSAADGLALLDHLGLATAHVAGISMGGMIAQTMAIEAPARVLSLTSIMSTTGRRTVGWQSPDLLPTLIAPRRGGKEAYVATNELVWKLIGSPDFPVDADALRKRAEDTFDRGVSASGVLRQMLAILTQPNRTLRLRTLQMPALVIHGMADKMVHVSGGRATASAIPGAELVLVDGMGHDLPTDLYDSFVEHIRHTADRSPRG